TPLFCGTCSVVVWYATGRKLRACARAVGGTATSAQPSPTAGQREAYPLPAASRSVGEPQDACAASSGPTRLSMLSITRRSPPAGSMRVRLAGRTIGACSASTSLPHDRQAPERQGAAPRAARAQADGRALAVRGVQVRAPQETLRHLDRAFVHCFARVRQR